MGTGSPAWPGLGESGDRWPLARQQAQDGGRSKRKGSWHGAERSVGNWENWGRRVSGHPGTSPSDCTEEGGQAAVTGFFCFTVRGVGPQWKLHWRQCGSRGKSPRVGPVPWSTSQTARQVQDGSLEALPQGSVVRQGSHMKSGQPGHSACLPVASHLRPAPALGKQLRKSSGNTNPPPSPSCSLRPDPPPHTPEHPQGGSATEACQPSMVGLGKAQWV